MCDLKKPVNNDHQDSVESTPTELKITKNKPRCWADEMTLIHQLRSEKADKNETTIAEMYYHLRSRGFTL